VSWLTLQFLMIRVSTIDDVLVSASGGEPVAVLSVGGFLGGGAKLIAVPLSYVRLQGAHMTMAHATARS
jgi:hypothetical protein